MAWMFVVLPPSKTLRSSVSFRVRLVGKEGGAKDPLLGQAKGGCTGAFGFPGCANKFNLARDPAAGRLKGGFQSRRWWAKFANFNLMVVVGEDRWVGKGQYTVEYMEIKEGESALRVYIHSMENLPYIHTTAFKTISLTTTTATTCPMS